MNAEAKQALLHKESRLARLQQERLAAEEKIASLELQFTVLTLQNTEVDREDVLLIFDEPLGECVWKPEDKLYNTPNLFLQCQI